MSQDQKKSSYGVAFYVRLLVLLALLGGAIWARYTKNPTVVSIVNSLFGRNVETPEFVPLTNDEITFEQAAFERLSKTGILVLRDPSLIQDEPGAVTTINMTGKPMTNDIANDIACLMRLKSADFSDSGITDSQMNCVVSLQELENLILTNTPVTDKGLVLVVHCPRLCGLQTVGLSITDAGLAEVLSKCTRIKILNLNDCKSLTNQTTASLANSEVEHLLIQNTNLDDGCIDNLLKMPTLRRLTMGGCKISPDGITRIKKQFPNITLDLEVSGTTR